MQMTARDDAHARTMQGMIATWVNERLLPSQPSLKAMRAHDLENVTPGWCSYCGKPLDRCPCGAIDHWNENPCPKCGPKPDVST